MDVVHGVAQGVTGRLRPRPRPFRINDLPLELYCKVFDEFVMDSAYIFHLTNGPRLLTRITTSDVIFRPSHKMRLARHEKSDFVRANLVSRSFNAAIAGAMKRVHQNGHDFEIEVNLARNIIRDTHVLWKFPHVRNASKLALKMAYCDELSHFSLHELANSVEGLYDELEFKEFTLQIMSSQGYVWWGLLQAFHEWTDHDSQIRSIEYPYPVGPKYAPDKLKKFVIAVKHQYLVHRTKLVDAATGVEQWMKTRPEVDPHAIQVMDHRHYTIMDLPGPSADHCESSEDDDDDDDMTGDDSDESESSEVR